MYQHPDLTGNTEILTEHGRQLLMEQFHMGIARFWLMLVDGWFYVCSCIQQYATITVMLTNMLHTRTHLCGPPESHLD